MAVEVGTAYVSVIPSAQGFAKKLKAEVAREFATADLDKLVSQAFTRTPIRVAVRPVVDTSARTQRIDIPVRADGTGLGTEVRALVGEVERRTKIDIKVDIDKRGGGLAGLTASLKSAPTSLRGAFESLSSAMAESGNAAIRMGGNIVGAATAATGPIGAVAGAALALSGAIAAAAGAALFAAPALSALAGAVASIPTLLTGAGAAFATLGLGFKGIGEAFKPKAGGGGGSGGSSPVKAAEDLAGRARQVAQATRGVESAQRSLIRAQGDVVNAQRAVNTAIAGEIERRQDLSRELRNAKLDQRDAALSVDETLRALNFAKDSGDIPAIRRAQLEFDQAKARVDDTADATQDLQKEQTKASRTSVRDSDAVREAMDRQRSALDGVRSAFDQVKSAQENLAAAKNPFRASTGAGGGSGGGGGIAAAVTKLAPAAQRFVNAIKAMRPAFESLRLDVQERLFKGLDDTVTHLGKAWLPQLRITLGDYADTFNRFFRDLGKGLAQPKFISDLGAGAEGFRKALEAIGKSVTDGLVPAFGALSRAGAPFVEAFGKEIAGIVTAFSRWVLAGEKSGALQEFFANATKSMKDIFAIGGSVARIIGNIIEIIVGRKLGTTAKSPLESFRDGLDRLANYLDDPANQERIRRFFGGIQDALVGVGNLVLKVGGWIEQFKALKAALFGDGDKDKSSSLGQEIGEALITGIIFGFLQAQAGLTNFVAGLLWRGPNSLIGRIKSGLGIASPSKLTTTIGQQVMDGLVRGIADRFGSLADRVRGIPNRIRVAFGTAAQVLLGRGRDVVNGLTNGITDRLAGLHDRVSSLRDRIRGAAGDTSQLLYTAGKNVVIGLWNGIASLGNWLANRVRDFINATVPGPIQRALGIASPSKVAAELGRRVPEGLALGIASGNRLVESAAAGMATAALPMIGPALAGNPTRGMSAASSAVQPVLGWARGASGDRLLDALRDLIEVRYGGDAGAAFASR
jgi:hypothetical protein